MDSKRIILAMLVLSMSTTGFAADVDNEAPAAAGGKPSLSDSSSYFQGVWGGKWSWGIDGVEMTITVGKKYKNGLYGTTYTWGEGRSLAGPPIKSGSVKAWGKDQGDKFLIEWKNKEGVKTRVTMVKVEEGSVKAIYDSDGPLKYRFKSDLETYVKRK